MMDNMTEFEKRKKDMKELWKDTFHDSDRYIDIVFDTYFSIENSFVRYHENRIIAAMLCVAYEFQILTNEGNKRQIKGMYLCGLATHPEWRMRGIMSDLMKEAEEDIKSRGFDFAFLIPADDHLREYYKKKGYRDSSWKKIQKVNLGKSDLDDTLTHPHNYSIKEFLREGKTDFIEQLADWCREIELSRHNNTIVHSHQDFLTIMTENENSIFLSSYSFDPEFPILANVLAVAFPEPGNGPDKPLRVVGLFCRSTSQEEHPECGKLSYVNNCETLDKSGRREMPIDLKKTSKHQSNSEKTFVSEILNSILRLFNQHTMELILPSKKHDTENGRVEPYAMIKPLYGNENSIINENLEFEISLMLD